MIVFNCTKCGAQVQVGDEYAGKNGQCPQCGAVVTIPGASVPGQAAATSAPASPGAVPMPAEATPPEPPKTNPQAKAAFVMGILSIFLPLIGVLLAVLAFVFGILGTGKEKPAKGIATAGLVLGTIGLAVQISIILSMSPFIHAHSRESAKQAACMANLHAIGMGVALYSGSYSDEPPFPLLFSGGDPNARLDSAPVASVDKINSTNTINNFWMLVNANYDSPNHFKCPSDAGNPGMTQAAGASYGWTSLSQCSYGMQYPYAGSTPGSNDNPAALDNDKLNPSMIIVADRNPGGPVSDSGGSKLAPSNHPDAVIMLRKDTTVKKYSGTADSRAGLQGDDIYVNTSGKAGGLPGSATDTSICPVPSR